MGEACEWQQKIKAEAKLAKKHQAAGIIFSDEFYQTLHGAYHKYS
jgi:hypothetical protein